MQRGWRRQPPGRSSIISLKPQEATSSLTNCQNGVSCSDSHHSRTTPMTNNKPDTLFEVSAASGAKPFEVDGLRSRTNFQSRASRAGADFKVMAIARLKEGLIWSTCVSGSHRSQSSSITASSIDLVGRQNVRSLHGEQFSAGTHWTPGDRRRLGPQVVGWSTSASASSWRPETPSFS